MIPREGKVPMRWRTIASLSFAAPALVACTARSVEVVASGSVPGGLETADATRVTVTFHGRLYRFDPAAELTFMPTFGSIWEPGVHVLSTSMYGGGGPEIWLGGE
jgi:hypothetical protein